MPFPESPPRFLLLIRALLGAVLGLLGIFLLAAQRWRPGASRWWNGDKAKLQTLVESCWWWAGLGMAVLVLGLLLTSRWWARPWPAVLPREIVRMPRWLVGAVLAVMVAGAAVRVPRLDLSLYNDEAHVFRAQLAGEVPKAFLGQPEKFRALTWWSTLYENRAGNNSLPFSLLSRTSYGIWRSFTGAPVGQVNETALRLPVLVCGVLGIGAIALLGWRLGGAAPALLVACLAAFHPWHLRYSAEARCYGMLLLAIPLLFLALDTALRIGRWRVWLAFGVVLGGTVVLWLGSAHFFTALYLTLLAMAFLPALRERRAALLIPATVAGVLALGLFLMVSLPQFVQLSKALQDPGFFKSPHPFPVEWFQDVAGFLGFGIPGLAVDPGHSFQPSVEQAFASGWGLVLGCSVAVWLVGLVAGTGSAFRQGGAGLALPGCFAGGAFLTWAYCSAKGIVYLKWYPLFLLPGLLLLLAMGLSRLLKNRSAAWWVVALIPLAASWYPGLTYYQGHGRENLRRPVELARGAAYPLSLTNPNRTLYGVTWSESPVYDPAAVTLKNAASLEDLIRQARQEKRALFVAHGHTPEAEAASGDILAQLRNPALFRRVGMLPGLDDASYAHYVYELLPGASGPSPPNPDGK